MKDGLLRGLMMAWEAEKEEVEEILRRMTPKDVTFDLWIDEITHAGYINVDRDTKERWVKTVQNYYTLLVDSGDPVEYDGWSEDIGEDLGIKENDIESYRLSPGLTEDGTLPIYNYKFSFLGDDRRPGFAEYDGTVVAAPDEESAWEIFLGMDGDYKLPDGDKYLCSLEREAYKFTPDHIADMQDEYGYGEDIDREDLVDMIRAWKEAVSYGIVE
jgi:hypothetical protein